MSQDKLPSVGVIGMGFVGGALARGLVHYTNMMCYDKYKNIGSLHDVCKQDILFVAVPTPMKEDGNVDTSIVDSVLAEIDREAQNEEAHDFHSKPVVLRSTLPPPFFDAAQKRYGSLEILYMPEFLTERTADLDFIMSTRFIIGAKGGKQTYAVYRLRELFESRFPGTRIAIMQWEEASMVKYATNNFFTVKLSFFNELYKICQLTDSNPKTVIEELLQDGRIGRSHFQVPGHDGDFGWGGHCFPKDNRGFSYFAKQLGGETLMADAAWDVNEKVRKNRDWEKMKGRAVSEMQEL